MRKIVDIYEKLKVDDIILDNEEFPINGTIDDIVDFLKRYNFKEVEYDSDKHFRYTEIIRDFDKKHKKVFIAYREEGEITFGDTSREEISAKNLMYSIVPMIDEYTSRCLRSSDTTFRNIYTEKEFAKEMKKYFTNK